MALPKIASSITSSKAFQALSNKTNDVCNSIGRKISPALEKHPKFNNFVKAVEPTGANNSFATLTTLMFGMVVLPRVMTAAKRNPDNKEATRDEIKEILFRDVQTVVIILFLLKMLNALIAGKVSKISGLPMTNKPYQKVFESDKKGFEGISDKAKEFFHNPIEKLKIMAGNVIDTINPTDGVRALANDEFVSRYSNVSDISDIQKIFKEIGDKRGNPEKIFDKVTKSLVEKQTALVNQLKGSGATEACQSAETVLEKLKQVQKEGYSAISSTNVSKLDENVKTQLLEFFKNGDNSLVKDAKKMNAALRTGALAMESTYLGFGLPALNQKRLEKKYLSQDENKPKVLTNPMVKQNGFNPLIDKTMRVSEVNVYKKFVK